VRITIVAATRKDVGALLSLLSRHDDSPAWVIALVDTVRALMRAQPQRRHAGAAPDRRRQKPLRSAVAYAPGWSAT
jgi:hypothetical protein